MKLSTAQLKTKISEWLSKPDLRKVLEHYTDDWRCKNEQDIRAKLDHTAERFGFRKGASKEEIEEHIWKLWSVGKHWSRQEKHKVKDEAEQFFTQIVYEDLPDGRRKPGRTPSFPHDVCGEHNEDLVNKYFNDLKLAEKCIYRLFVPNNDLADSFRLEVITTPEDDEVVGWWVTVD